MKDIHKIVLNTADAVYILPINEILFCKSNNSYTTFFLINQKPIVVSRNIKELESELTPQGFFRSHQSFLVNLNHVLRINKTKNYELLLTDGTTIPISVRKKKSLLQIINN